MKKKLKNVSLTRVSFYCLLGGRGGLQDEHGRPAYVVISCFGMRETWKLVWGNTSILGISAVAT